MSINPDSIWQRYGLDTLQNELDRMFPEYHISLNELLEQLLQGKILESVIGIIQGSVIGILNQVTSLKNILLWILILGIASSLITHFVEIFDKHQIADLSFYFLYLLFMTVLIRCFQQASEIAGQVLENIIVFMQLMIPTYMLAVGVTAGVGTVTVVYQIMLGLIYVVEYILKSGIMPFIHIYICMTMINGIWVEEKLTLLVQLMEKAISAVLKAAVGAVTGISVFQSLITPSLSVAKFTLLQKVIGAIPGIGNAAEGVTELVIGSASILKNSIGAVCLLVLIMICAAPLLYIFLLSYILRLSAAVLGIVSNKRLVECTNKIGEGCMLLFRTVATALLLFLVSITVVALSTNRGI